MLVIIGLIVGGVLVGQDLISSAQVRSVATQIEKYQTAVNTFRAKYNALPGDMDTATASKFGFTPRPGAQGQGDGNGLIEGYDPCCAPYVSGSAQLYGETVMFWVDLTTANGQNLNLIDSSFNTASFTSPTCSFGGVTTEISLCFPVAKMGQATSVYVNSWYGKNYFGLAAIFGTGAGFFTSANSITVKQAYSLDKKLDDGLPESGNVIAAFVGTLTGGNMAFDNFVWPGFQVGFDPRMGTTDTRALPASSTTCFDNNGVALAPIQYSMTQNAGNGPNCVLSFRFQ